MKNLSLKALTLLLGVLISGFVHAQDMDSYYGSTMGLPVTGTSGVMTYALNNVSPGVVSAVIDMRTYGGMYLQVTGVANAAANLQYSNVSYTASTFATAMSVYPGQAFPTQKRGSWARFVAKGITTTSKLSVFYEPVAIPVADNGSLSFSAQVLSQTALATYDALSYTSISLATSYAMSITSAAGIAGPAKVCFSCIGTSGGFYYSIQKGPTAPTTYGWYYACSTTPICDKDLAANTYLFLTVTSATAITSTPWVIYSVKH